MADVKISGLGALAGADLADNDLFPVVDTSATLTKKITPPELLTGLRNVTNGIITQQDLGWGNYADTVYTTSSRLTLSDGVATALPNNKGSVLETYKPTDIATFYNGTVITGRQGEGLMITIDMQMEPQVGANYVEVWFDIGGSVGELYRQARSFPKGTGNAFGYICTTAVYTLDTWQANGATVYAQVTGGSLEIWDIRYVIHRLSKVG